MRVSAAFRDHQDGGERAAHDQLSQRLGYLPVGRQVGLELLPLVNATSAWPSRTLSAFESIFASRPAVA
jgi:hypothetical protein